MSFWRHQLSGPTDPARDAAWEDPPARKGFFTDTSICIGCKACEVACKEWNMLPMDEVGLSGQSYDNTNHLGANTWRHVAFVEQGPERVERARATGARLAELGMPRVRPGAAPAGVLPGEATSGVGAPTVDPTSAVGAVASNGWAGTNATTRHTPLPRATEQRVTQAQPTGLPLTGPGTRAPSAGAAEPWTAAGAELAAREALATGTLPDFRWLIASDVCKHCTHAGCLDVCPTGSLFRTEFGTVVVQDDVCNGCGYCVAACPFGVIERRNGTDMTGAREPKQVGIANKCTLCYDRLHVGATPACAQACPTTSIQFGDLDELRERARERAETLHGNGFTEARVYGADPEDGVGGTGSIFLLLDDPEVYGLPPDPVVTTHDLPDTFAKAGYAASAMLLGAALAFAGRRS